MSYALRHLIIDATLGDYCEDDAKDLIISLRKARVKCDTRINFVIDHFKVDCIEGRLSELREVLKDTQKIEQVIAILKSVLAQRPNPDDFKELFLKEYNPLRENEKSQIAEILNKVSGNFQALDDDDKNKINQIFLKASDEEQSYYEARSILHRNKIEIGEEIAGRLEDPIIRITRDLKELGIARDHPLAKQTVIISAQKRMDVFIDEFSTILALQGNFNHDFFNKFPAECSKISVLGSLLSDLSARPSSGKLSMNEFADRCAKEFDTNGNLMIADFQEYAADLARIIEKNGIVKVKGDSIKWKS